MTTVGPGSPLGASDSGTSELSVPEAEPASTSMLVPDAIPRSTSPDTLCTVTWPWRRGRAPRARPVAPPRGAPVTAAPRHALHVDMALAQRADAHVARHRLRRY